MTPNQMNAAIPERRPATEEISGLIERVTDFGNRQVYSRNSQRSRESWLKTFGRNSLMKHKAPFVLALALVTICFSTISAAQALKPVQLPPPQTTGGAL